VRWQRRGRDAASFSRRRRQSRWSHGSTIGSGAPKARSIASPRACLGEIEHDQGAVLQLTPEGIDLFNAAVVDRAGIDYGCVVTGVPKPREQFRTKELLDPEYIALRALFRLLHALTARPHPRYPYPIPSRATQRLLDRALGFKATPSINDGIVPTLSQLHGRVLHVACADHLDVVGHYTMARGRTADWLPSGAGFTPAAFDATWDAVAKAIARG
jgi:hypothetical protein